MLIFHSSLRRGGEVGMYIILQRLLYCQLNSFNDSKHNVCSGLNYMGAFNHWSKWGFTTGQMSPRSLWGSGNCKISVLIHGGNVNIEDKSLYCSKCPDQCN